jgi:hypothetical protein
MLDNKTEFLANYQIDEKTYRKSNLNGKTLSDLQRFQ